MVDLHGNTVIAGVFLVANRSAAYRNLAGIRLIDIFIGYGAQRHTVGLAMDASGIGAIDGDMERVVLILITFDLDGVLGAVLKLEVQGVAVDGGVSTHHRHIAAVIAVLIALHDFQIGFQSRPVQGRG